MPEFKSFLKTLPCFITLLTLMGTANAKPKISFELSFIEPQAHYVEVAMTVSGMKKEFIEIKMPVWTPGSYLVREFAKNVESLSATASGKTLSATKIKKNTWQINSGGGDEITLKYRVYANEISARTSFVDAAHAFISPTGIFMYVDGMISAPATVTVKPYKTWSKISTGLEPVSGKANTFYASDFDILFDSPIEIGNQDIFEFDAVGVKHEVAMYGGGTYNKDRLKADMTKIVEEATKIFGENPNKRYVFIVHNFGAGGGGLEHLNSTVLGTSRNSYSTDEGYKGFLGLVAHEYFHLWNVKRLRPKALGPFDYDNENYTTNLWIAEGFTAYYDNLILRRAGIYSPEEYLNVITGDINAVENQPGTRVQPVSEASFDAWIKYYRPNENSRNSTISYYDKGALVALLFDLEILHATGGKQGLDDVMKAAYDEFYKKQKRGFTDAEFKAVAEKVAGNSFDGIYADYVNGTKPVNLSEYFGHAGIYVKNDNAGKTEPYLGIGSVLREGKITVAAVSRGSAAWKGGLNAGDEIIAIDNNRISGLVDIDKYIPAKKVGDVLRFIVSRDGMLQELQVTLQNTPNARYRLDVDEAATAGQVGVRKRWLRL